MASSAFNYITRDEYTDSRNIQDTQLNHELVSIRASINRVGERVGSVEDKLDSFKSDAKKRFCDIDKRFDEVDRRFDAVDKRFEVVDRRFDGLGERLNMMQLDMSRMAARFDNGRLNNPLWPLTPIVAYDADRGIIQPDSSLYPKNAKQFYALEYCSTLKQQKSLAYLIRLYDVPVNALAHYKEEDVSDASSEEEAEEPFLSNPQDLDSSTRAHVIDFLANILGLEKKNFDDFRQRAAEMRNRPSTQPPKRPSQAVGDSHLIRPRAYPSRLTIHSPHPSKPLTRYQSSPSSEKKSDTPETRLLWHDPDAIAARRKLEGRRAESPRQTQAGPVVEPAGERAGGIGGDGAGSDDEPVAGSGSGGEPAAERAAKPSDWGSTTNADTLSRDARQDTP